jgi:hypothetical protein
LLQIALLFQTEHTVGHNKQRAASIWCQAVRLWSRAEEACLAAARANI